VDGGPRLEWLDAVRARHPVSLHGVSLSLAADAPPDPSALARLARLVARFEPALVSEHLAWSSWRGAYLPDLLPFPRTRAALDRVAANVSIVQDALKRRIAIENPSHYLALDAHELPEIAFLEALSRRTGCARRRRPPRCACNRARRRCSTGRMPRRASSSAATF